MLADIRSRNDDFGFADVVVFHKNNLEKITDILVVVDDFANLVDQVDDGLSHPVSRSSFAAKD